MNLIFNNVVINWECIKLVFPCAGPCAVPFLCWSFLMLVIPCAAPSLCCFLCCAVPSLCWSIPVLIFPYGLSMCWSFLVVFPYDLSLCSSFLMVFPCAGHFLCWSFLMVFPCAGHSLWSFLTFPCAGPSLYWFFLCWSFHMLVFPYAGPSLCWSFHMPVLPCASLSLCRSFLMLVFHYDGPSLCWLPCLHWLTPGCLDGQEDEEQLQQTNLPDTLQMALHLRVREKQILQQTVSFAARRKQMAAESADANGAS